MERLCYGIGQGCNFRFRDTVRLAKGRPHMWGKAEGAAIGPVKFLIYIFSVQMVALLRRITCWGALSCWGTPSLMRRLPMLWTSHLCWRRHACTRGAHLCWNAQSLLRLNWCRAAPPLLISPRFCSWRLTSADFASLLLMAPHLFWGTSHMLERRLWGA